MNVNSERYKGHRIFGELRRYIEFYDALQLSAFGCSATGLAPFYDFNSRFYSSMQGTLESIQSTLKSGRLNDAYALLRKYHDCAIINIYCNLYAQEEVVGIKLFVEKIHNWRRNEEPLPRYREMSTYIRNNSRVGQINQVLYSDGLYKKIRDRCNSHMHYNLFFYTLLNDPAVHFEGRLNVLEGLSGDVADLFILHFAYTFFLNQHYMSSTNYVDALDCGLTPAEDSQYWVAPFVQEMLDGTVSTRRPDILATLKKGTCMQLS